jgi:hypothetical protein
LCQLRCSQNRNVERQTLIALLHLIFPPVKSSFTLVCKIKRNVFDFPMLICSISRCSYLVRDMLMLFTVFLCFLKKINYYLFKAVNYFLTDLRTKWVTLSVKQVLPQRTKWLKEENVCIYLASLCEAWVQCYLYYYPSSHWVKQLKGNSEFSYLNRWTINLNFNLH